MRMKTTELGWEGGKGEICELHLQRGGLKLFGNIYLPDLVWVFL